MRPVLVTDGGNGQSRSALAAVRALGAAGHDVHVTTTQFTSVPGWSRHCHRRIRMPAVTSAAYAPAIDAPRSRLDYVAVFPASDAALLALGWPGASLVHNLEVAGSAERAGFPVAAQQSFDAAADLIDAAEGLRYPVVVKTEARGSPSSPAVWRADAPADLSCARGAARAVRGAGVARRRDEIIWPSDFVRLLIRSTSARGHAIAVSPVRPGRPDRTASWNVACQSC